MPELPEVETVRRGLTPILGQRIVGCDVRRRDVVRDLTTDSANPRRGPIDPTTLLIGSRIAELARKGKQLAVIARDDSGHERAVVLHLGMSGQVMLTDSRRIAPAKHAHVVWSFETGTRLVFRDARRFGKVVLHGSRASLLWAWDQLGPDGLVIDPAELYAAISGSVRAVKAVLLDQSIIAGVGNIYADEALFDAGIHPATPAGELTRDRVARLTGCVRAVLARAIDARGSTLRDYRDASGEPGGAQLLHRVYGRAGEACRVCGMPIATMRIVQRTTCFCPGCQI